MIRLPFSQITRLAGFGQGWVWSGGWGWPRPGGGLVGKQLTKTSVFIHPAHVNSSLWVCLWCWVGVGVSVEGEMVHKKYWETERVAKRNRDGPPRRKRRGG